MGRNITFAIPMNNVVIAPFFVNFFDTLVSLVKNGDTINLIDCNDTYIYESRWKITKKICAAYDDGDISDKDGYIIWLDSDQCEFDVNTINTLISRFEQNGQFDILSAIYYTRSYPPNLQPHPIAMKKSKDNTDLYKFIDDYSYGEIVNVDVVGMGMCVMRPSTLYNMKVKCGKSMFHPRIMDDEHIKGEDVVFCVDENSIISTNKGLKNIKTIKVGDKVLTHKGVYKRVLSTSKRIYIGKLINIKTCTGNEINCTENHKILVKNMSTGKNDWVEANKIKQTDYLFLPKERRSNSNHLLRNIWLSDFISLKNVKLSNNLYGYKQTRKSAIKLSSKIPLTLDVFRLIGYYISEGSSNTKTGHITMICGKDLRYIKDCEDILKKMNWHYTKSCHKNGIYQIVVTSKIISRIFSNMCGSTSSTKKLPKFYNSLTRNQIIELLKGYYRGDGRKSGKHYEMTSNSNKLLLEIQYILLKLDIVSRITQRKTAPGDNKHWSLCIGNKYPVFSSISERTIKCDVKLKNNRNVSMMTLCEKKDISPGTWVKIDNIQSYDKEVYVYNLKVDKYNSFCVNNIAIHNCENVKREGYMIGADTTIQIGHGFYTIDKNVVDALRGLANERRKTIKIDDINTM